MKKILSLIMFGSLIATSGLNAGWRSQYFWESDINKLLVAYGSCAFAAGLGFYGLSIYDRANVTNAMLDKKILNSIDLCVGTKQSTENLIPEVNLLHITQEEKDILVTAMRTYNDNTEAPATNLRTLLSLHLEKVDVILRYENNAKRFIRHSKYTLIGLLIYNFFLRDGSFIAGVRAGLAASQR